MAYAQYTKITVEQTKTEIERLLGRYGASKFAFFAEQERAIIVFEAHDRRLRFDLPLPKNDSEKSARQCRESGGHSFSASRPSSKASTARSRVLRKRFWRMSSCQTG